MAAKQFKIGECVVGGIIKVDINGDKVKVKFLDYNSKKEILSREFNARDFGVRNEIDYFITDNGTSYYAGKVVDYIQTIVLLN